MTKGYVRPVEKWRGLPLELRKRVVSAIRAIALGVTVPEERDAMRLSADVLERGRARELICERLSVDDIRIVFAAERYVGDSHPDLRAQLAALAERMSTIVRDYEEQP